MPKFANKDEELAYYREKEKTAKVRADRLRAKNSLLIEKAKAQGITVSDTEIDNYLKNKK